eukprot:TRINITY_DN4764_c0_g2_i1.p1 TRINITY_DN4764_c0_g2~~TRINITY_DN4764_c0_g2_i1.p1  ORF type:complete len:127 (+),score=19.72 TRINITY_DN4764_c0_g2_i1:475-855(+)
MGGACYLFDHFYCVSGETCQWMGGSCLYTVGQWKKTNALRKRKFSNDLVSLMGDVSNFDDISSGVVDFSLGDENIQTGYQSSSTQHVPNIVPLGLDLTHTPQRHQIIRNFLLRHSTGSLKTFVNLI